MSFATGIAQTRWRWGAERGTAHGARADSDVVRRTMIVLILGTFMTAVDATVTNVALHTIGTDLHRSVGDVQWVITGYLLALAATIPVSGWMARRFGARRVYVLALGLFAMSSALCSLANSLTMLVASRAAQGAAGGLMTPLSQLIAAEVGGPRRMGRMVSRVWMVTSLGSILGPSLGGVIVAGLSWRWIFLINVPLGLLATYAAVRLLPETPARAAGRLDVSGLVRLGVGIPSLLFALAHAEATRSLTGLGTVVPLVAGLALLLDFVRHALRCQHPLLDLRLFARPMFAAGTFSLFTFDVAWFGALILLPLYFQQVLHATPLLAGLLLAPQGLGTAVGMAVSGRFRDNLRGTVFGAAGVLVVVGTTMSLAHLGASPYWVICSILLVAGFGAGLAWVPATASSYADLAPGELSHASALVASMMRLGAAFGTALAAIVLQGALAGHVTGPSVHLIAAYDASFRWAAVVGIFAFAMFVALCRATSQSRVSDWQLQAA